MKSLHLIKIVFIKIFSVAVALWFAVCSPATGIFWRGNIINSVPVQEKIVAITFDDGPHPIFTPQILNILARYHVKATFFMIGRQMEKYPAIVQEVVNAGHVIGNHTYTHPKDIDLDTRKQVAWELERCERVIERMTGKRPYLFRPPRGLIDGTVFNIAEEEGYRTVLWSVSADHHDAPTPRAMADRVVKLIRPGGIILVHDGRVNIRWRDVTATSMIIEDLQKQGYRFVTVPELLRLGTHLKTAVSLNK